MDQRTIILVVTLLTLVIVGMLGFAYLKNGEISVPVATEEVDFDPYAYITRVDVKHFYSNGTHTFGGEFEMPTPCDLIDPRTLVSGYAPESVRLDFNVINSTNNCPAEITRQRFLIQANAAPDAIVSATFMGREIIVNLIPAAEGEKPSDFQLMIKG